MSHDRGVSSKVRYNWYDLYEWCATTCKHNSVAPINIYITSKYPAHPLSTFFYFILTLFQCSATLSQQHHNITTIPPNMSTEDLEHITIFALYWQKITSFKQILEYFESSPKAESSDHALNLRNDLGRLRVWAENVGAHRKGTTVSLDHRLREAPDIAKTVKDLLSDLNTVLDEGRYHLQIRVPYGSS
jgi:hypothetical protein